jgi:hypothetical protein
MQVLGYARSGFVQGAEDVGYARTGVVRGLGLVKTGVVRGLGLCEDYGYVRTGVFEDWVMRGMELYEGLYFARSKG